MSKRFDPKNNPNLIENPERAAQELYGYDDETLLRELKEAEMELEQMKAEDPELEAKLARETEAGFEALMQKIHAENIKPVTEREYAEKKKEEERKVTVLRPVLKVMFIAAAIMVVLSGMGIVVSARKEFEYQKIKMGNTKNEVIWNSTTQRQDISKIEQAYERINSEIGITVLKLDYVPPGMIFEGLTIEKGHATLEFSYKNKKVYFKQIKYVADNVSEKVVSDRLDGDAVYNKWLDKFLYVEENELEDSQKEYCVDIDLSDAHYYLSGIMEKNIFDEMVSKISYYQN